MHIVKLNISDEVFGKFLDFLETLPKESIGIEEIDGILYCPSISIAEVKEQISKETDIQKIENEIEQFFDNLLK